MLALTMFASTPVAACTVVDKRANAEIDRLVKEAEVKANGGDSDAAVTLLKQAITVSETRSPKRLYSILNELNHLLDDKALVNNTDRMATLARRLYGPSDFRTIYSLAFQTMNAGEYRGEVDRMIRDVPPKIFALQQLAKTPEEVALVSAFGSTFVTEFVIHGHSTEARDLLEKSLEILKKYPNFVNMDVAKSYTEASGDYAFWYDLPLAINNGLHAIALYEKLKAPYAFDLSYVLGYTAGALTGKGRYTEAEPLYERALKIVEHRTPKSTEALGRALNGLAQFYDETGHPDLAGPLFVRAANVAESLPPSSTDPEALWGQAAQFYYENGNHQKAKELNDHEIVLSERHLNSPFIPKAYLRGALIAIAEGRLNDAEGQAEKGRILRLEVVGANGSDNSLPLTILARIAGKRGNSLAAADYWARAIPYITQRQYPNRERESTVIAASWYYTKAMRDPKWDQSREAGDSLTGRVIQSAIMASGEHQKKLYEPELFDHLLDIGWASR